ncbi:MAG: ABC transporter ATP-binding protein [Chthonomonadales bacterium]
MDIIEAQGITKEYDGVRALDHVSFHVEPGQLFALVGPNGAGKTTLLRLLTGILRPDSGSLKVLGSSMILDVLPQVGYMPEERGLYRGLTPEQTVTYFARLRGVPAAAAKRATAEALERVGMARHARRKLEELSKGMAQRVQLAATIVHRPRLLILDEPFSGLDPVSARDLQAVVRLQRDAGATVLLSTHNMEHAEKLCDHLLMLYRGAVKLFGAMAEIKRRYSDGAFVVEVAGDLPELPGCIVEAARGEGETPAAAPLGDAGTLRNDPAPRANAGSTESRMQTYIIRPEEGVGRREVLAALLAKNVDILRFEPYEPTLEDIFIREVGAEGAQALRASVEASL